MGVLRRGWLLNQWILARRNLGESPPPSIPSWREQMSCKQTGNRGWVVGYLELMPEPLFTLTCPAALGTVGCGEEGRQREVVV